MTEYLRHLWEQFRTSLWFVPTVMSLAVILLAIVLVPVDALIHERLAERMPWLAMSPAAARVTLSAIAGAMVTSTSLVFSITIVAVSIAASQFGSRLIRTFRNNRVTHWTLGAFVATSLYCLLLLVVVREGDKASFVPYLAVYVALFFSICCLGLLIYFIHDTAVSVQAPNIVQASASDLDDAIDRMYPGNVGSPPEQQPSELQLKEQYQSLGRDCHVASSTREGYVQAIDTSTLMHIACDSDIVIELLASPGSFLTKNLPLAKYWSHGPPDEETEQRISSIFITDSVRTPRQDVKYAIDELVEVAVRALSPGINDPFTAITCVDRLGAAVGRVAQRQMPSAYRCDDDGRLRLVAPPVTFCEMLDAALNQIRQNARSNVSVFIRLLTALEAIAVQVQCESHREAVMRHADMLQRGCQDTVPEANDRDAVQRQYERVEQVLQQHLDKDEAVKHDGEAAVQEED